jgi:hypothetical protein
MSSLIDALCKAKARRSDIQHRCTDGFLHQASRTSVLAKVTIVPFTVATLCKVHLPGEAAPGIQISRNLSNYRQAYASNFTTPSDFHRSFWV